MSNNKRTEFCFYKNYYDAISQCDNESRLKLCDAIFDYVFTGKIPNDFKYPLNVIFNLIRNLIDEDIGMNGY